MPRPRPPYLHRETTRHGKTVWYVRKGEEPRIRIAGEYGSPEFMANYQAAMSGRSVAAKGPASGSLTWLLEQYRQSGAWAAMAPATRYKHEKIFRQMTVTAGAAPFADINRKTIIEGRERRASTPSQARHFLDSVRGLFGWALEAGHVATDPTDGVKNPPQPKTKGFPVWTEADVSAFERRWPLGTRQRVWLDLLLYTGLRRGDAARVGPSFVSDGVITLLTEKGGEMVEVNLPILPILARTLAAGPVGTDTFVCNIYGKAFTKESFGNAFSDAARDAGIKKSAHGLRKTGATRAAENGATESELKALFGWSSGRMAALYARSADRKRLSNNAIEKLEKVAPKAKLRVVRDVG